MNGFRMDARLLICLAAGMLGACAANNPALPEASATPLHISDPPEATANPSIWPSYSYPVERQQAAEQRIDALVERMTIEEKIGQLLQADICCVTAEEVREYNLGSVLAGGNSGPGGDDFAPPEDWLAAADAFYDASVDRSDGGVGIPVLWGIDAVHGHSNIIGATIFPHNIGLGAARDPALIEQIGAVTATEIRVTGQEWTFAPTVAVPQDFRWGRAYEGYSSDPDIVSAYAGAMIRGLQGAPDQQDILGAGKVLASTKHYLADGGTLGGVDQGDAQISEAELRDIHGAPYGPAIENGVATVMASFSSWNGSKLTGNRSLLTDVLKNRMGFDGFVVSDWNAHGQVSGCSNASCPRALEAGIDLYMAPDSWKDLYADLLAKARSGDISMQRIDEAVAAILRVKMRLGLFEAGRPSDRPLSGEWERLGAPEHRAVARDAVRKSLVLLKNTGVLPLSSDARILVAGDGADDVARQSGGWTLTWQGTGIDNSHFPGATTVWSGLANAILSAGGQPELQPDGRYSQRPDAAIVVFGEEPYAEFQGDRETLQLDPELTTPLATMNKLKSDGIPVIALMLTGRPLYINPVLNTADAVVIAWLPGSEGDGIADVLIGDQDGNARFDFVGLLPADWPISDVMDDGVLFPIGYGLDYARPQENWETIEASLPFGGLGDARVWFANGAAAARWSLLAYPVDASSETRITAAPSTAANGCISIASEDYLVQEGARKFTVCSDGGMISLRNFEAVNVDRETNGDVMVVFTARLDSASGSLALVARGDDSQGVVPLALEAGLPFQRYGISLKCLREAGANMQSLTHPFAIAAQGAAAFSLADVRLGTDADVVLPCS